MHRAVLIRSLLGVLAATAACGDSQPQLPGELYYVQDQRLVHDVRGARTVLGEQLFPSAHRLPDGRLVAIRSRGDGSPDGEQLVLVSRTGAPTPLGPACAQVREPALDARGRFIVVAANCDGHSDLYRYDLAGSITRLTDEPAGNFHPTLAGDSIVYVSSRDGSSKLYRDDTRLTGAARDDWSPAPSPRGDTIAFLSDRDGATHIYLVDADGRSQRRLTTRTTDEDSLTWSRDGAHLAYVTAGHVIVRDMLAGTERDLTPPGATDLEPAFSPDGKWLALARGRDIVAIRLDDGETLTIATNARLPRWHP